MTAGYVVRRKRPLDWNPKETRGKKSRRAREGATHTTGVRICPCGHDARVGALGAGEHTCIYAHEGLDPSHRICACCTAS